MEWNDLDIMSQFIMQAGGLAWIGYLSALIYLLTKKRKSLSALFSMAVFTLCDFLVILVTPVLYEGIKTGSVGPAWWYPSFILIYAFSVFSISWFHKSRNVLLSKTSVLVMGILFILAIMDAIMYVDQLSVVAMEAIYHFTVPAFKILAAAVLWKSCYAIKE